MEFCGKELTEEIFLIPLNAQPLLQANKCRNCLKTLRTTEDTEEKKC